MNTFWPISLPFKIHLILLTSQRSQMSMKNQWPWAGRDLARTEVARSLDTLLKCVRVDPANGNLLMTSSHAKTLTSQVSFRAVYNVHFDNFMWYAVILMWQQLVQYSVICSSSIYMVFLRNGRIKFCLYILIVVCCKSDLYLLDIFAKLPVTYI